MSLVIPDGYSNWHLTFTNVNGGASAKSTVAFGMATPGALAQADVGRIANILRDGLTGRFDSGWTLGPTHVVEGGTPPMVWDDTGTEAGTIVIGTDVTPAVALVVSKSTGLLGKPFRGRLYLPGLSEAAVSEAGIVDGTFVNLYQTAFDDLQDDLIADAAVESLQLFHDETSPFANTPTTIQSFVVRNVIGSMRPRQRR